MVQFWLLELQENGGARRDRTADLLRAKQALSQLSYGPFNLSFFRHAALHLPRAWSHRQPYAPGARVKCALPGEKNPALKNTFAGSLKFLSRHQSISFSRQRSCRTKTKFRDLGQPFSARRVQGENFARKGVYVRIHDRRAQNFQRRNRRAEKGWWVWVDLNHRPHPYQGCALTN